MTPTTPARCLNCDTPLIGRFCPECGQKASSRRLRLGELVRDGLSHLFSLDSQVTRTAVGLTRNPGRVCLDYVEGKRVRYVAPLRYCLIVVALMLLVNALVGFDPSALLPREGLSEQQEQVQTIAFSFVARHLDLAIFLVLPALVLIFRLLFWRSPFNLAEVSVFVLYTMAQVFLLGLLLAPLRHLGLGWQLPLRMGLQVFFLSWSAKVFFDASAVAAAFKSAIATLLYLILLGCTVILLLIPQVLPILRELGRDGS